jgi:hypothetical protein
LAYISGVGPRFVGELESGAKDTLRMDEINQVLAVFDYHLEAVADREINA